ncbi:DUF4402 domain-containing protein [Pseudoalteromonas sp. PB2-1]|uniref:DUF4402 domain-containing protein n=1 Tax=Pseudoalteromonas sp. PB2-1 TaxID=2907242 RepID=UPI003865D234
MKNSIKIAALMTSSALLTFNVAAEQTTFQAAVTVQNAFTLQADSGLDFGTIRATADATGAQTATLVLPANPATSATTASTDPTAAEIAILNPGAPALFSVSGVSPFATLNITNPTETDISPDSAPSGTAKFVLGSFTYYVLTGANPNSAATTSIQVDANGEATFNLGATLSTDNAVSTADYIDGTYSGTFTLQLDY